MLDIIKKQIQYNYSVRKEPIKYIVVHYTANYGVLANAEMHFNYFNNGNRNASADFFVDSKSIWQVNDYVKNYSWHCGDGAGKYGITNSNSIGIEICVNKDGDLNIAIKNTIQLVAHLMQLLNIPLENVKRHYDASRKLCPLFYCGSPEKDNDWLNFKKLVLGEMIMKDYKQILKEKTSSPDVWIALVEALQQGNLPVDKVATLKFLKDLIEKIGN